MQTVYVGQLSELKQVLDNSECSKTRRWAKQTLNRIDRRTIRISLQEQVWTKQPTTK